MKTNAKAEAKVKILISTKDPFGNKHTLAAMSDDFGTIKYRFWGSWNDSGCAFAISNLMTRTKAPVSIDGYKDISALVSAICDWIHSGTEKVDHIRFAKAISNITTE